MSKLVAEPCPYLVVNAIIGVLFACSCHVRVTNHYGPVGDMAEYVMAMREGIAPGNVLITILPLEMSYNANRGIAC